MGACASVKGWGPEVGFRAVTKQKESLKWLSRRLSLHIAIPRKYLHHGSFLGFQGQIRAWGPFGKAEAQEAVCAGQPPLSILQYSDSQSLCTFGCSPISQVQSSQTAWVPLGLASEARSVPTATVSAEAWQLRFGAAWKQARPGLWRTTCRGRMGPSSSLIWRALSGRSVGEGGECPVRMAVELFSAARSVQRQVAEKAGTVYSAWT